MKTAKIVIAVSLVLMVIFTCFMACSDAKAETETETLKIKHYPSCGTVVEVNRENGRIVVEDFNGNLWAFEGGEDWLEGDICAMTMSDEGTPSIYDDVVIQARYCGWNY